MNLILYVQSLESRGFNEGLAVEEVKCVGGGFYFFSLLQMMPDKFI